MEKVYVLHFVENNCLEVHETFETAKKTENKYASILTLNCVGRWSYTKYGNVWKTKWEDSEDGSEFTSFIYEKEVLS